MLAGIIGGAVQAGANIISAVGKKKEAQRQLDAQRSYAGEQRSAFEAGYGDLLSQAKSAPTYQGDISRFQKVEQQADLAKRMASGMSRGAGEQIARDQAAQTSANVLAAATRGAGSGTDIMTAALLSQQGENQAQNAISARSAQEQMIAQNQAQQQQFAALGQTAAASARERGLEFQSLAAKQAGIMGVTQNKLEGQMNLNQNLFESEQAKAAALEEARGAIYSGIGKLASGIGGGIMGMQNQASQMSALKQLNMPGASAALRQFGGGGATAGASSPLQGLGAFLSPQASQLGSRIPSSAASPYSAPSPMMPTYEPFNIFGNLPQPR
jgi:hypothetical protein